MLYQHLAPVDLQNSIEKELAIDPNRYPLRCYGRIEVRLEKADVHVTISPKQGRRHLHLGLRARVKVVKKLKRLIRRVERKDKMSHTTLRQIVTRARNVLAVLGQLERKLDHVAVRQQHV